MKSENSARSKWILIGTGLLSFLTMITYLIDILTPGESPSLINLGENMLRSFPFVLGIAYIDYQLVKYIYRTRWLYSNLILRIPFELIALSVLAVLFVLIGSLPFKYNSDLMGYIHSMFYVEALPATQASRYPSDRLIRVRWYRDWLLVNRNVGLSYRFLNPS